MDTPPVNIRALLMVILEDEGDAEGVDRLADMTDEQVAALGEGGATATFASERQDGETWETNGRYYARSGGITRRVDNPSDGGGDEPGDRGSATAVTAPDKPPAAEPEPEPTTEPAAADDPAAADKSDPAAFEQVLADTASEPPESRAATIASWIVAPIFPQTRARVEEGLAQYLNGDHNVHRIVSEQAQKLFNDPNVPSVERAYAGVVSDLFSGEGKPLGDVLRDRLEPVRNSFRGDNLKINAIQATTLALATAVNAYAPGAGSALGAAIDEIASQIIEKDEQDWGVIAQEATKAATIGVLARRLGGFGKSAGGNVAGKAAKAVTARTGSELAGKVAKKATEIAAKAGTKQVNKAVAGAIRGIPTRRPEAA